jgi:hypothetical protein
MSGHLIVLGPRKKSQAALRREGTPLARLARLRRIRKGRRRAAILVQVVGLFASSKIGFYQVTPGDAAEPRSFDRKGGHGIGKGGGLAWIARFDEAD